jgi:hypothetical protein
MPTPIHFSDILPVASKAWWEFDMIKGLIVATVMTTLGAQAAFGQSFPTATIALPTPTVCVGCFSTTPVPIESDDFLFLQRAVPGDGQNGFIIKDLGGIALSSFASAQDLAGLRSSLGTFQTSVDAEFKSLNYKIARGLALASVTDLQSPEPGKSNRIGGMVSAYNGQVAGAISYVHRAGQLDFGGAVGVAHGATLGKAGAGFSW